MCGKGVATLRLKDPQVDLQICDADPEEVGRLLKAIKLANQGQSLLGKHRVGGMSFGIQFYTLFAI